MNKNFALVLGLSLISIIASPPGFCKDASTANAVKVDDSAQMLGTQVKTYEERTNTRRSLRTAANHMQEAAKKDRSQSSPGKVAAKVTTSQGKTVSKVTETKKKAVSE